MKLKYILGISLVVVTLIAVYYNFNPEMYNFFPECPFHKYLHLDCPGCGSQRAIHALLHGNIMTALDYNVLLVLSIPVLLVHFSLKTYSYFSHKNLELKFWYSPQTPKIIFVVVLVFWIARNLPYQPFTYLAA